MVICIIGFFIGGWSKEECFVLVFLGCEVGEWCIVVWYLGLIFVVFSIKRLDVVNELS